MKNYLIKILNWSLIGLAIVSLFLILIIGLEAKFLWTELDDPNLADNINKVLLNISYSYITGFLVYLLTVLLPHALRRNKIKSILETKLETIKSKINASVMSIYLIEDEEKTIPAKDLFIKEFVAQNITDKKYKLKTGLDLTLFESLVKERKDIERKISEIIEYHNYLSTDSLTLIERIRDSEYFSTLIILEGYQERYANIEAHKNLLAGFLYDLYDDVKNEKLIFE